jgi:hypothetical protein
VAEAAEAEEADEAVRVGPLDDRPCLAEHGLRAADERDAPLVRLVEAQTPAEVREAGGEAGQVVRRDGLVPPDVVGRELPEAHDLRPGLGHGLLVAVGHVDLANHDHVAPTRWVAEGSPLGPIGLDGAHHVVERLA